MIDFFKKYGKLTIAAFLYACGVSLFLDPNFLVPGGVTGIAMIGHRLFGIETGTAIIVLNIPLFLIGIWKFGWRFFTHTLYSTVVSSVCINILSAYGALSGDFLGAALAGGILMAAGLGITFREGSSTGGMDIIIKLLRLRMPHIRTGSMMLFIDAAIVGSAGLLFGEIDHAIYGAVSVMAMTYVLDMILYGTDEAKLLYVVSKCPERISLRFLQELDVGVTYLQGSGAFSGRECRVILCVMRKPVAPKAQRIVREEDPAAFMIVGKASEIYGEGYKSFG